MATKRNDGGKQQPAKTELIAKQQLPALRAADFGRKTQVSRHMGNLLAECEASEAAAALVPWFCDALPSAKSRKDYYSDLRLFFNNMQELGVHPFSVTGDHIRLYKESMLQAGRKAGTIARALSVIRGTYEQFGKKGLVPWERIGDIQSVTAPRVEKNSTPAISEQEAIRMLEAPDRSTVLGMRDFALLFTYFKTACRSAAIANATVGSLEQTDTDWYLVVQEKGGKTRRLPLLESAASVLEWLDFANIRNNINSPLFPAIAHDRRTVTERSLSTRAILNIVKKYAGEAGLQVNRIGRRGICTHTLRKTSATNSIEHGAPIHQVQQWLGHADIRTTQTYVAYRENDAEAAARHNQIRPKNV